MRKAIQVLWLKRDLRLSDHAPLAFAEKSGLPLVMLYFLEPSLLSLPEHSARHWQFCLESVEEMNGQLQPFGHQICIVNDEVLPTLGSLATNYEVKFLLSHQETGQWESFQRDLQVKKWCKVNGVTWKEFKQQGVTRGLKNRESWAEDWDKLMYAPVIKNDLKSLSQIECVMLENESAKHFSATLKDEKTLQEAGEQKAWESLNSFLSERGRAYTASISKPLYSREHCSRLSTYLAWGNISMRQVVQATQQAKKTSTFKRDLANFSSRLYWHCHFIQKFETEPRIEFENLNRAYDSIRQEQDPFLLNAWKTGMTGFPLVDACMRCVNATGYLNFRMRAMVTSFLTHHLFQDWRSGVSHLAQAFLDYEPGIHFCQFQMQAGTMGINTFRIYNPEKQALEQDPEAKFIKQWVPELAHLPDAFALAPYSMSSLEQSFHRIVLGKDYPLPVVNLKQSYQRARDGLYGVAKTAFSKEENKRILAVHVKSKQRMSND